VQNAKPRIAVVTAIAGGKNDLIDPASIFPDVDYFAFTNAEFPNVKVWQIRSLPEWSSDSTYAPRRNAKLPKILPELVLPGYDYYIWHDPTNELVLNPFVVISHLLELKSDFDIAVFKHRTRSCVYDESKIIKLVALDLADNVNRLTEKFKKERFPEQQGLYELGVIVRKNSPKMLNFDLAWWELVCRYSSRDQISFPFVLWRNRSVNILELPGNVVDNDFLPMLHKPNVAHFKVPLRIRVFWQVKWKLAGMLRRVGL